ncbi:MAG: DUF3343 domain-containing protein [Thermoleophilia bacterium]|nr:DUF3343 domain-containing protein [Thermoleophilia bacterium]
MIDNNRTDGTPASSSGASDTTILLFDTTHTAMAGEQAIIDAGFWCDVVPKPPDAMTGLCGLAIAIRDEDLAAVRETLVNAGLAFEIYQPEVEAH